MDKVSVGVMGSFGLAQVQALTKLMRPESIETLKRRTTTIAGGKAGGSGVQEFGPAPEKLTVGV